LNYKTNFVKSQAKNQALLGLLLAIFIHIVIEKGVKA
jgi:hypothetical protein